MNLAELIKKLQESLAAYDAGYEAELGSLKELANEAAEAVKNLDVEGLATEMAADSELEESLAAFLELETKIDSLYTELQTKHDAAETARAERAADLLARVQAKTGKAADTQPGEESAGLEKSGDQSKGHSVINAEKLLARKIRQPEQPKNEESADKKYRLFSSSALVDARTGDRVDAASEISWAEVARGVASKGARGIASISFADKAYDVVDNDDGTFTEQVLAKQQEMASDFTVLSASSICARETDFSVQNLSTGCAKFANSLPVVRGNRVYDWYNAVYADLSGLSAIGGGVWTDADYDDPLAEKTCEHPACGNKTGCELKSLYWCYEVNRFQELSHPEQVAALKELMDVYYMYRLENLALESYFDTLSALPFTVGPAQFGSNIDITRAISRTIGHLEATIGYSGNWDVWLPSQAYRKLAGDAIASPFRELTNLETQINAQGDSGRVRLGEYCGTAGNATIAPIPGGSPLTNAGFGAQALPSSFDPFTPGTGGAIPAYPLTNRILIAPAASGVRNVLSEIRIETKETIVKNNTKKIFFEQDNQICFNKLHYALDVDLCDSGATGAFVNVTC